MTTMKEVAEWLEKVSSIKSTFAFRELPKKLRNNSCFRKAISKRLLIPLKKVFYGDKKGDRIWLWKIDMKRLEYVKKNLRG